MIQLRPENLEWRTEPPDRVGPWLWRWVSWVQDGRKPEKLFLSWEGEGISGIVPSPSWDDEVEWARVPGVLAPMSRLSKLLGCKIEDNEDAVMDAVVSLMNEVEELRKVVNAWDWQQYQKWLSDTHRRQSIASGGRSD